MPAIKEVLRFERMEIVILYLSRYNDRLAKWNWVRSFML